MNRPSRRLFLSRLLAAPLAAATVGRVRLPVCQTAMQCSAALFALCKAETERATAALMRELNRALFTSRAPTGLTVSRLDGLRSLLSTPTPGINADPASPANKLASCLASGAKLT